MKISYNWLKKYIDFDMNPFELADYLTFSGIEVEEIEKIGTDLQQIIVAEIREKRSHPDADKLSVCIVYDGKSEKQVVCGAPNCASGQKIAFAPIGVKIGEIKIKKAKLRGIESFGMICSEKELGISNNHEGIMVLPENAPSGVSLAEFLGYDDSVYDVEITPNRPDLLGIFGVARDLSARLNTILKAPELELKESKKSISELLKLENQAPDLCPRYTARVIENVTIKESPEWLKKTLSAIGLRPINNVVDVTNFVMMELGHPLHAFDYSLIKKGKIVIRRAKHAEKFPALDEDIYSLAETDLVIADSVRPVALAGIIGGLNSHITQKTTTVVLETANFLYSTIRKTAAKFNISTDSSYRFERDLPEETIDFVSRRAAYLIQKLAGGEILEGVLDSYPQKQKQLIVELRPARVRSFLEIEISDNQIIKYLKNLGLELVNKTPNYLTFKIPVFRKDLSREIDLIEEIIRLHGYNNVKSKLKIQNIMDREAIFTRRGVKDLLVHFGMSELVHWNFGDPGDLDKLGIKDEDRRRKFVKLINPLGASFSIMRSTLLPDLLKNALYNINHGQKNIKTFEMAKVFFRENQKLAEEKYQVSGLMIGNMNEIFWKEESREVDFFDIKGILNSIFSYLDLNEIHYKKTTESYYQTGIAAEVYFKNQKIATLGKMDPKVLAKFDIDCNVFLFEIFIGEILDLHRRELPVFKEIPKFPPVLRDISFLISKKYNLAEIKEVIAETQKEIINKIVLFDQYTGKNISADERSLSFSLVFSSPTNTLTDEYINDIVSKVIKNLENKFDIKLR